jgi:CubicO group peptidase (beta-lactamase class C family)
MAMSAGIPEVLTSEILPYKGSIAQSVGDSIVAPLLFVPGTAYYYSNPSFILAGYFVEKLSGMPYGQYVSKHITGPIGLLDTTIDFFNNQFVYDPRKVGTYHEYIDAVNRSHLLSRGECTFDFDTGTAGAAGGFLSTVADESTLYYTLFNFTSGGAPLLTSMASLESIVAPQTFAFNAGQEQRVYYGQGIYVVYEKNESVRTGVWYEGGFLCTTTVNLMDFSPLVRGENPTLVQAYRNKDLHYVPESVFNEVVENQAGNFITIDSSWQPQDPLQVAQALKAFFFP